MKKLLFCLALLSSTAQADISTDTIRRTLDSFVRIDVFCTKLSTVTAKDEESKIKTYYRKSSVHYMGSGVVVTPEGLILTVAHLFSDKVKIDKVIATRVDGSSYTVHPTTYSHDYDLAVLHPVLPQSGKKFSPLFKTRNPAQGTVVYAIGNPLGFDYTITSGIISHPYRRTDFAEKGWFLQSDTVILPGNSGGPLFNDKGEIVGISSFMHFVALPGYDGLSFFVSVESIREYLRTVLGRVF